MSMPQANEISPAVSGVNSMVTGVLRGRSRRIFREAKTTWVAQVLGRAIVERHDGDALGQSWLDLGDPCLHGIDDLLGFRGKMAGG